MSDSYETPEITDLGSLSELTEFNLNKNPGSSDTITISGQPINVPGSGPTP